MGYVGSVSGACLGDFAHTVNCVYGNAKRTEGFRRFEIPSYECELGELVERHARLGHLHFSTGMGDAMRHVGAGAAAPEVLAPSRS